MNNTNPKIYYTYKITNYMYTVNHKGFWLPGEKPHLKYTTEFDNIRDGINNIQEYIS